MTNSPLQSRITRHAEVDPATLVANAANWRTHPPAQRAALEAVLTEVGWVQNVIVNERTDRMIDGHLRVEVAVERGEATVPVVYVDLSEEEERTVLASLDTITSMAGVDTAQLSALLDGLVLPGSELNELLQGIIAAAPVEPEAPTEFPAYDENIETQHQCPSCGYEWSGGE